MNQVAWLVFCAYVVHSAALLLAARYLDTPFWHGKVVYWLDVCWYGLMVYCSGGSNSFFFPFFFFVILTASFQWGFDEGARVTLGSALILAMATLLSDQGADLVHLLLRTAFVLALGYMIAYWGGLGLAQRRRLALLRNVSRLSNPRFGVTQTIQSVLQQTRQFYQASNCVLLMREQDSDHWLLYSATEQDGEARHTLSRLSAGAAAPLLAFDPSQSVLFARALHARLPRTGSCRANTPGQSHWARLPDAVCEQQADLFDAESFISAPLPLRKGSGRLYVVSASRRFGRADARFLHHLAAQVFPVIENIELLDRLASDAAFRERQKIARDLHDTTIQPYIGLRHGLSAVRQGVRDDDPLAPELDKLLAMATDTIADMRNFAKQVRADAPAQKSELLVALRRQAKQMRDFYNIDIGIVADEGLRISDRLAAEVFQIASEGMSNIRKHTLAKRGQITLACESGWLRIQIDNEGNGQPAAPFRPGSLTERAMALGGSAEVGMTAAGATAVYIAIPV
ncbi:MAG: histidine kinase, partial [Sphingomonadaceae bacterium]